MEDVNCNEEEEVIVHDTVGKQKVCIQERNLP